MIDCPFFLNFLLFNSCAHVVLWHCDAAVYDRRPVLRCRALPTFKHVLPMFVAALPIPSPHYLFTDLHYQSPLAITYLQIGVTNPHWSLPIYRSALPIPRPHYQFTEWCYQSPVVITNFQGYVTNPKWTLWPYQFSELRYQSQVCVTHLQLPVRHSTCCYQSQVHSTTSRLWLRIFGTHDRVQCAVTHTTFSARNKFSVTGTTLL